MNTNSNNGLFLVTESNMPILDTHALANDIIARLERDLALANPNRARVTYLPDSFYETRLDTPVAVLSRVLKNLYSFAFSA